MFPDQEAAAVAKLPEMLGHQPEAKAATGTYDATPGDASQSQYRAQHKAQQLAPRLRSDTVRSSATQCEGGDGVSGDGGDSLHESNPFAIAELGETIAKAGDEMQANARACENSRGGTRTRTRDFPHGILSPVRLPIPPLGLFCKG